MKDLFEFDGGSVVPLIGMGYSGYVYSPKDDEVWKLVSNNRNLYAQKVSVFFHHGCDEVCLKDDYGKWKNVSMHAIRKECEGFFPLWKG
jgi:hypothetical protein